MKRIAIIGGSAAGCAAAIECKRLLDDTDKKCEIIIFEALGELCKKILATGNGRCNILNADASAADYNGDREFIKKILGQFTVRDNIYFLNSIGIVTKTEDMGRIYPLSSQASSVKSAIENEIARLKIRVITDTKIRTINRKNNTFLINGEYAADAVIVAGGGKSSPAHGSDGSCIEILKQLGHKITTPLPALAPIYFEKPDRTLKGVRADGRIEILSGGSVRAASSGELQFTDYGISGIPAMEVSGAAARLIHDGRDATARITLIPQMSRGDIFSFLMQRRIAAGDTEILGALCGIINRTLAKSKLKAAGIDCKTRLEALGGGELNKIAGIIKTQEFKIKSTGSFTQSQVTSGGARTCDFSYNLQSKKLGGLFAAGEVLDADGKCGGYNLGWCISSGRTAGAAAANYIIGENKNAENK